MSWKLWDTYMQKVSHATCQMLPFSLFHFPNAGLHCSTIQRLHVLQCFAHWAQFFFSNMTLISIFQIDIQITYSLEHTGEVLLWSSSNEQEYLIRKTNFSVSCKFPILPWRFSESGDFMDLKLSLMFIYEHYFSNREAGVRQSLNVRF